LFSHKLSDAQRENGVELFQPNEGHSKFVVPSAFAFLSKAASRRGLPRVRWLVRPDRPNGSSLSATFNIA
jgi:hypothetical protein